MITIQLAKSIELAKAAVVFIKLLKKEHFSFLHYPLQKKTFLERLNILLQFGIVKFSLGTLVGWLVSCLSRQLL